MTASDKAHFDLDGYVNVQNCRHWASENPRELHRKRVYSLKVTLWYGVFKMTIVGVIFFKEKGSSIALSSAHYIETLNNSVRTELKRHRVNMKEMWF